MSNKLDYELVTAIKETYGKNLDDDQFQRLLKMYELNQEITDYSTKFSELSQVQTFVVRGLTPEKYLELKKEGKDLTLSIDDERQYLNYLLKDGNGVGTIPTENIQMTVAPRKSGKSTFINILIASVLGCGKDFGLYSAKEGVRVLHIDTEQCIADQQVGLDYIHRMCKKYNMPDDEFKKRYYPIHARSMDHKKMQAMLETLIITYQTTFIVIDGVAEMVEDINEQAPCKETIDTLHAIAEKYKCAIMCVIHTNKMKRNEEDEDKYLPRGAIGSVLENLSTDGFLCLKSFDQVAKQNVFRVKEYLGRHQEIKMITFIRDSNEGGMPKPYFEISGNNNIPNLLKNAIQQVFANNKNQPLSKTELVKRMSETLGKGYGVDSINHRWSEYQKEIEEILFITGSATRQQIKLKDPTDSEQTALQLDDVEGIGQQLEGCPY